MYNRTEIILEAYPQEFTEIHKARGSYICIASDGARFLLQEFRSSQEKAEQLKEYLDYINSQGIVAEQLAYTKEGLPLFTDVDEKRYFLRSWFEGKECDTRNKENILCAVRRLAQLHRVSEGFETKLPARPKRGDELLEEVMDRHTRELHKVRNYIKSRKKKNEFEARFLKEYDRCMLQADTALEQLRACRETPKERCFGICHGDYNQHNLLFTAKGPVIVHYERFCQDAFISDFANFFRKMMEKHNWNTGLGMELVNAYEKERRLEAWEMQQLYLRMAYPEKFWKVANHYFNSRKSWANNRDLEKLEKICAQETERADFLRMLFHFTK